LLDVSKCKLPFGIIGIYHIYVYLLISYTSIDKW